MFMHVWQKPTVDFLLHDTSLAAVSVKARHWKASVRDQLVVDGESGNGERAVLVGIGRCNRT